MDNLIFRDRDSGSVIKRLNAYTPSTGDVIRLDGVEYCIESVVCNYDVNCTPDDVLTSQDTITVYKKENK